MGKILASDFSDLKKECLTWGVEDGTNGVSTGSSATAASMNSVYETVYNIFSSELFIRFAELSTFSPTSVSAGRLIYNTDLNYITGPIVIDDKVGEVTSGLLTFIKSQCLDCACDGSCDGTHSCSCYTTSDTCSCHYVCNGYVCANYCSVDSCACNSHDGCPCDRVSHVCDDYSCYCYTGTHNCDTHGCHEFDPCPCDGTCYSHCAGHCPGNSCSAHCG